jgi:hypothetical protein
MRLRERKKGSQTKMPTTRIAYLLHQELLSFVTQSPRHLRRLAVLPLHPTALLSPLFSCTLFPPSLKAPRLLCLLTSFFIAIFSFFFLPLVLAAVLFPPPPTCWYLSLLSLYLLFRYYYYDCYYCCLLFFFAGLLLFSVHSTPLCVFSFLLLFVCLRCRSPPPLSFFF